MLTDESSTTALSCRPVDDGRLLARRSHRRCLPTHACGREVCWAQVQPQAQCVSRPGGLEGTRWTISPTRTSSAGLRWTPWTIGHGLLSGRPQVRVLPGARESPGKRLSATPPEVYRSTCTCPTRCCEAACGMRRSAVGPDGVLNGGHGGEGVAGPRTMGSKILPRARPAPAQGGDGEAHWVTLGGRRQVPRSPARGARRVYRWGTTAGDPIPSTKAAGLRRTQARP